MNHLRILVTTLLLVAARTVLPCTCGPDPTREISLDRAFRNSPIVFRGSVIRVTTDLEADVTTFTFRVTRYFKGVGGSEFQVVTTGPCRALFSREVPYLVFAGYVTDASLRGRPFTSQCSGNRPVTNAPDYSRVLGAGSEPPLK
jgi:hypothetical protein